jgi:hypothetical protein
MNIMKKNLAAPLLFVGTNLLAMTMVAATAFLAPPVFASGFGPAPSYNPIDGAPASQRGQSALTLAAQNAPRVTAQVRVAGFSGVGGVVTDASASGTPLAVIATGADSFNSRR